MKEGIDTTGNTGKLFCLYLLSCTGFGICPWCVCVCVCGRITDGQRARENSSSVAEAGVPMTARLFSSVPCGTSPPFSPLSLRSLIGHKWFPSRGPLSWLISSDAERDSGAVSAKRRRFFFFFTSGKRLAPLLGDVNFCLGGSRRVPPCPNVNSCPVSLRPPEGISADSCPF